MSTIMYVIVEKEEKNQYFSAEKRAHSRATNDIPYSI